MGHKIFSQAKSITNEDVKKEKQVLEKEIETERALLEKTQIEIKNIIEEESLIKKNIISLKDKNTREFNLAINAVEENKSLGVRRDELWAEIDGLEKQIKIRGANSESEFIKKQKEHSDTIAKLDMGAKIAHDNIVTLTSESISLKESNKKFESRADDIKKNIEKLEAEYQRQVLKQLELKEVLSQIEMGKANLVEVERMIAQKLVEVSNADKVQKQSVEKSETISHEIETLTASRDKFLKEREEFDAVIATINKQKAKNEEEARRLENAYKRIGMIVKIS